MSERNIFAQCFWSCPYHETGIKYECVKLPHRDDDTAHECSRGHNWRISEDTPDLAISQEQPQPRGTGTPVGERLIELIRERTKLGVQKYGEPLTTHNRRDAMLDALQESIDLNQYLMQKIMESEDEIHRLSEEQIKPLANFLMQQSDVIGHPRNEGACAMAIRVIGELIDKD